MKYFFGVFLGFYNILQTIKHNLVHFDAFFKLRLNCIFLIACHHFFVPATQVPEIVQLVLNRQLLAISSMSEVRSEHYV